MDSNLKEQIRMYDELYLSKDVSDIYDKYTEEMFFEISNDKYFFPKVFNRIGIDKVVLDIGCGGGNVGIRICKKVRYLVNLDASFNALMHACGRIGKKRSKYAQGDMCALPFRTNTFDVVICYTAQHHVEDINTLGVEIKRVLKNGGTFLSFEPAERYSWIDFWMDTLRIPDSMSSFVKKQYARLQNKISLKDNYVGVLEKLKKPSKKRHFFKTPGQYRDALSGKGFSDVKVDTILTEFLPPRFFAMKNRTFVKGIFLLSDLFDRAGLGKEKGRFIIIEASKKR